MKTYNETRVNLNNVIKTKTVEDDKGEKSEQPVINKENGEMITEDLSNIKEEKANEIIADHKKRGWPEPEVTKKQTFQYSEPEAISEVEPYLATLGLDPAVAAKRAVDIFQRGWAIEQQSEIRNFMAKTDPVEGVYSVAADAATPAERRAKDPLSAALANLKKAGFNVSADDLQALMANFKAAPVNAPTNGGQEQLPVQPATAQ